MSDDDLQPVDARGQDPVVAVHKAVREAVTGHVQCRRTNGGVYAWVYDASEADKAAMASALQSAGYDASLADDPPDAAPGWAVYVAERH